MDESSREKSPPRIWPKAMIVWAIDAVLLIFVIGLVIAYGPRRADFRWLTGFLSLYGLQALVGLVLSFSRASRLWGFGLVLGFCLFVATGLLVLTGSCLLAVFH
jgi:hypothetical protein